MLHKLDDGLIDGKHGLDRPIDASLTGDPSTLPSKSPAPSVRLENELGCQAAF